MTVRMKSLKAGLVIAGKRRALGEEFVVDGESQARVLAAIKSAERMKPAAVQVPPVVEKVPFTYTRRDMVAESAPVVFLPATPVALTTAGTEADRPKRAYRRKDATSE